MHRARRLAGLVGIVVTLAAVALGLGQLRTDTTTASLLPLDDATQRATAEAARSFGGDPVVVIAESHEPGALLGPDQITRLVGLEGTLSRLPDVAVVYGPGTVLNQVAAQAQNLLATIVGRRDALRFAAEDQARMAGASKAEVAAAGDKAVERFDVRYGSLLVKGLPAGLPTLRNPSFVRAAVFDRDGQPRQQWRFVVPSPNAVSVVLRPRDGLDQGATERLVEAVESAVADAGLETSRVTVTGMPVVAAGLGDVLREEIPVLGAVALALIAACYLLLPWIARRRARLLPLLATLGATAIALAAFGWLDHPVSLGVVAFLPILLGTGSDFPAYLVRGADRRRVVVTAVAAAAGFASLAISSIPFVRDLGLALAAGVMLAVGLGLVMTRGGRATPGGRAGLDGARPPMPVETHDVPRLRHRGWVFGAALAAAVAGWLALPSLDIAAQPDKLAAGLPEITSAQHAEDVLGSAGEVQILVRGDDVLTTEALAWMNDVQDVTVRSFGDRLHPVASPSSLLAFLGDEPTQEQVQAGLDQLPSYLSGSVIRSDRREAVMSFGIELGDIGAQQQLLADLHDALPTPPEGITVDLAGLPVVAARSYELLSADRYLDSALGIVAAGLVLLIGLRRKLDAVRAIVAAILATGWGLAGAAVLGVALTPLTLALGSLATATACEFSVLLSTGSAYGAAQVRRAVLVAAMAATSGYLALSFSGLAVIRDFGFFLAATVVLSLIAAQVMRVVLPTRRPTPQSVPDPVEWKAMVLV